MKSGLYNYLLIGSFCLLATMNGCISSKTPPQPGSIPECKCENTHAYSSITEQQALEIAAYYRRTDSLEHRQAINGVFPVDKNFKGALGDTTQAVWFPLSALKAYICAVETEINKNKDNCKKVQGPYGIRIYYARYPDGAGFMDPKYANRHTVFMVPTYYAKNASGFATHWDFNPAMLGEPTAGCPPDKFSKPGASASFNPFILSPIGLNRQGEVMNHGQLTPPYSVDGLYFR